MIASCIEVLKSDRSVTSLGAKCDRIHEGCQETVMFLDIRTTPQSSTCARSKQALKLVAKTPTWGSLSMPM